MMSSEARKLAALIDVWNSTTTNGTTTRALLYVRLLAEPPWTLQMQYQFSLIDGAASVVPLSHPNAPTRLGNRVEARQR